MWPFDQPENCATIVSRSIIEGKRPILLVAHDDDDHGWQFLDGVSEELDDLAIIALHHILDFDPEMAELASLESGFEASRSAPGAPWVIVRSPVAADDAA
ncbi:hypothetical protein [Chitinilyticum litopenaei]|uniref:hypothetical protein n=1 Tax=Chitinilyticum litopenaei TaxID=1121276 RepID=UPI000422551D|nr:hypothetical protein [Chitinilyticum litopenaei]